MVRLVFVPFYGVVRSEIRLAIHSFNPGTMGHNQFRIKISDPAYPHPGYSLTNFVPAMFLPRASHTLKPGFLSG